MSSVLGEIEAAVGRLSDQVGPSVVRVGRDRRGSGVVVAPGRVLTNAHNLRGATATVVFSDGSSAMSSVSGVDADGDLAVLSVDTGDRPAIRWDSAAGPDEGTGGEGQAAAADVAALGSAVFAVGAGIGGSARVTFGTVSGRDLAFRGPSGRRIQQALEHTAPLPRGSSGGPVVDASGRLVGINTHRLGDGFYLALPATAALRRRVEALAQGQEPTPPRLGVGLASVEVARRLRRAVGLEEVDGLLVRSVQADGPAARAGVREGDLLVTAGGTPLLSVDDLHDVLVAQDRGSPLALGVVRGADRLEVTVAFDAPKAGAAPGEGTGD